MFYHVVFRETVKVKSSSIPAEKYTRKSQEISQRFREVVYVLYRLDEDVYCEIPAVAITGTS